jgi:hypothetical protein
MASEVTTMVGQDLSGQDSGISRTRIVEATKENTEKDKNQAYHVDQCNCLHICRMPLRRGSISRQA